MDEASVHTPGDTREALIEALRSHIVSLEGKIAALEAALVNYASENELLKRKLYGTKSERNDTSELQLLLGDMLQDQAKLQEELAKLVGGNPDSNDAPPPEPEPTKTKPTGRRNLSLSSLPTVVVELTDPDLEKTAKCIGYEESRQLMYQRGGFKVLVKRLAKYEVVQNTGERTVLGVQAPPSVLRRALVHSSVLAWLAVEKFALGVPHYRLEQHLEAQGESLDRGTMGRYMEEMGNALGATIVNAMERDAILHASVLSTDATGASILPAPEKGQKQACKKGHFFTIVADAVHVLYVYTEKHSQDFVAKLFHGFRGYLQSDASSVYDILDRGPPKDDADAAVTLVGCWAHCRRYFFDAAVCKHRVGVEGLTYLQAIFFQDQQFAKLPPSQRKALRLEKVLPLVDAFFQWVSEAKRTTPGRNLATRALTYATNQEKELRRVFLDGRLPLDNSRSERALRKVVVGRKNWLFYGSDSHAEAAAALFSLIASCRLHKLDPELYLDEILRVLPYWPREQYLELAPNHWRETRARLSPKELEAPIGVITVPAEVVLAPAEAA